MGFIDHGLNGTALKLIKGWQKLHAAALHCISEHLKDVRQWAVWDRGHDPLIEGGVSNPLNHV